MNKHTLNPAALANPVIESGALDAMRASSDAFDWLRTLQVVIREIAEERDDGSHQWHKHVALARIKDLASAAAYIACEFSNSLDCARETLEGVGAKSTEEASHG